MARCDAHDFGIPVRRDRLKGGAFVDHYGCRHCDKLLSVHSDPVNQRTVLVERPGEDWTESGEIS